MVPIFVSGPGSDRFIADESPLLVLIGWGLVVVVAVSMLVLRGREEAAPAIVFAAVAVVMAAWMWRRGTWRALVASLVVGALWLLQFAAYAIADVVGDELETGIFVVDVVGVVAGVAIVAGAIRQLVARRRAARPSA